MEQLAHFEAILKVGCPEATNIGNVQSECLISRKGQIKLRT